MSAPRLSNSSRTPISERIKLFGGVDKARVVPPARTPLTPDPVSIQRPALKPTPSVNSGLGSGNNGVGNNGKSQFSAKDPTKGIKKSPGSANSSRSDLSRTPSNASTRSTSTPVSKAASRTGSVSKNSPSPSKKNINGGSQAPSGIKKLPVSRKLSDKLVENNNNNMANSSPKLSQVKEPLEMSTPPAIEEKTPPRMLEKKMSATVDTIDTIIVGNNSSAIINFTDRTLEVSEIATPSPVNSSTGSLDYRDTVDRSTVRKASTDIMFTEQTYNNRKVSNASIKSDISSISSITTNSTNGQSLSTGMITVNGKMESENYFTNQALNNTTSESYSKVNHIKVF